MEKAPEPAEPAAADVSALSAEDAELLCRLRAGDEDAFAQLVTRYHPALVRLAMTFVSRRAVAEEVVQETWVGVLQGLAGFAGRSSLKTWIFRILMNRARTRGEREGRTLTFADLAANEASGDETAVDPAEFWPAGHPQWAHVWVSYPGGWESSPEERALSGELQAVIRAAVEGLPPAQRTVIALRDVVGWSSGEVCNALAISETNQRVLLHRARAKVRAAIDEYRRRA